MSVVELRQYRLHPGRRDDLVDLFDSEFVESQERCGIEVLGQFRDLDDPDRFVWLRGFSDLPARPRALTCFYDGPVWTALADQANATMADWSDVLLLRPLRPGAAADRGGRAPVGAPEVPGPVVVAVLHELDDLGEAEQRFDREVAPVLAAAGVAPLATLCTEPAENTFPRLPLRSGERVLATVARLAPGSDRLAVPGAAQVLRLAPTGRSLLR